MFAYYPGCSQESSAKELEQSTELVFKEFGIEYKVIPDWNCCGASAGHAYSQELAVALPLRNLILAEKMGVEGVVTTCAACYSRLKAAQKAVEDVYVKERMEEILDEKFQLTLPILYTLEILRDKVGFNKIREKLKLKFQDLKVASYYGCLLTRPPEIVQMDDVENPMIMDNIVEILGGTPLDWSHKTECCGAALSLSRPDLVLKLSYKIINAAKFVGADCIAVACPLCHSNLDLRQPAIRKKYHLAYQMPVLFITQLIGMALGFGYKKLGMHRHMIDPRELFSKLVEPEKEVEKKMASAT